MPHRPAPGRTAPTSTYRVQLQPDVTFADAADQVPYLARLGVSHLYLSPVLQAAPGSTHGYDVVDHTRVNEELGGIAGLRHLAQRAHAAGLGLVADVVPNHMAVPTPAHLNRPWWSLLAEGRASPYAHWFDVDWPAQDDRVLIPLLGSELPQVLADGELHLADDGGADGHERVVRYHEHEFPVRSGTEHLPLAELLQAQWYRLAYWRRGEAELNYRRFFDVTTLAAIRVEDREVFDATHAVLVDLVREGSLDGLRIDHPDGLADPAGYLDRLGEVTGGAWVVVEKILEGAERLPEAWRCAGTTGYDTLLRVGGLFVDASGEPDLTAEWVLVSGDARTAPEIVLGAKEEVVARTQAAEVARLLRRLRPLCPGVAPEVLHDALAALLVSMDRYRAYVVMGEPVPRASREALDAAADRARTRAGVDPAVLDLILDLVSGAVPEGSAALEHPEDHADLVVRFQQVCGPVMAKGIEDTTFYRYHRLDALNEVGGDPAHVGVPVEELHDLGERLLRDWPTTMTTLSTHDTKRSEDVRARLAVLAERAGTWRTWVHRARELVADRRPAGLDGATEYLIWQTLVGTWPISADRLTAYLTKAVREAKVHTTWTEQDTTYEQAVTDLAELALGDDAVVAHVERWVQDSAPAARATILGQKLIQLLLPGVPDVFQGCEVVSLALVDPDNRRPVDHIELSRRLHHLEAGGEPTDVDDEKLLVVSTALRLRRDRPEWFTGTGASYAPVPTSTDHAVAVARGAEREEVIGVASRFTSRLADEGGWGASTVSLPPGSWRDLLGGRVVVGEARLADLLVDLPVALLVREDG